MLFSRSAKSAEDEKWKLLFSKPIEEATGAARLEDAIQKGGWIIWADGNERTITVSSPAKDTGIYFQIGGSKDWYYAREKNGLLKVWEPEKEQAPERLDVTKLGGKLPIPQKEASQGKKLEYQWNECHYFDPGQINQGWWSLDLKDFIQPGRKVRLKKSYTDGGWSLGAVEVTSAKIKGNGVQFEVEGMDGVFYACVEREENEDGVRILKRGEKAEEIEAERMPDRATLPEANLRASQEETAKNLNGLRGDRNFGWFREHQPDVFAEIEKRMGKRKDIDMTLLYYSLRCKGTGLYHPEASAPEVARKTFERYYVLSDLGITFGQRHGGEVLENVYQTSTGMADYEKKLAIVLYNKSDWNNAFGLTYAQRFLRGKTHFEKLLDNGYNLIICEMENQGDFLARLFNHGMSNDSQISKKLAKIKYDLIHIGGHGNPYSLQLGSARDETSKLDTEDFDIFTEDWKKLATKKAAILLESCSTAGYNNGDMNLAEFIASRTGIKTIGATAPTGLENFIFDNDGYVKDAKFYMSKSCIYQP